MSPALKTAKISLSYPVYACAFDPNDSSKIFVGGGGGAGRSGVGNKITLLDASDPDDLKNTGEVDLSKDEDSVTSLAVGQSKEKKTLIYAGVNSSPDDVVKGKNAHFRVFGIESSAPTKISELSRSTLFASKDKDTYQRVLKLSRPSADGIQLGAALTGFARQAPEIVLFDTRGCSAKGPNIRGRLQMEKEAVDADIIQTGPGEFNIAYCTDHEIFLKTVSSNSETGNPVSIYSPLVRDNNGPVPLVSFRAVRYLSPTFLVVLVNLPDGGGVQLHILRTPLQADGSEARVAQTRKLLPQMKKATGLAICNLSPPPSIDIKQGHAQFVIAVASQDISLSLFVVELQLAATIVLITQPKPLEVLKKVHPLQITGLTFSNFTPPKAPNENTPPQTIKLVSVSMGNTVVTHTLPLKRKSKDSDRYISAIKPSQEGTFFTPALTVIMFAILFVGILVQGFMETQGLLKPRLGAEKFLKDWNPGMHHFLTDRHPFARHHGSSSGDVGRAKVQHVVISTTTETAISYAQFTDTSFAESLEKLKANKEEGHVIFVRSEQDTAAHETNPDLASSLQAALYDEALDGPHGGKTWEELGEKQKQNWIKKLKEAGHYVEDMGETILKGVVFGEMGAAMGG